VGFSNGLDISITILKKKLKLYFYRFVKKWKNDFFGNTKRRFPLALAPFPPQAELIWILKLEKALKARKEKNTFNIGLTTKRMTIMLQNIYVLLSNDTFCDTW
jgi:hypothetical protein